MVEFALVVPILLLVVFAIIQFGMLYNNYITLTDATRVGARKGAVSRTAANPVALQRQQPAPPHLGSSRPISVSWSPQPRGRPAQTSPSRRHIHTT